MKKLSFLFMILPLQSLVLQASEKLMECVEAASQTKDVIEYIEGSITPIKRKILMESKPYRWPAELLEGGPNKISIVRLDNQGAVRLLIGEGTKITNYWEESVKCQETFKGKEVKGIALCFDKDKGSWVIVVKTCNKDGDAILHHCSLTKKPSTCKVRPGIL